MPLRRPDSPFSVSKPSLSIQSSSRAGELSEAVLPSPDTWTNASPRSRAAPSTMNPSSSGRASPISSFRSPGTFLSRMIAANAFRAASPSSVGQRRKSTATSGDSEPTPNPCANFSRLSSSHHVNSNFRRDGTFPVLKTSPNDLHSSSSPHPTLIHSSSRDTRTPDPKLSARAPTTSSESSDHSSDSLRREDNAPAPKALANSRFGSVGKSSSSYRKDKSRSSRDPNLPPLSPAANPSQMSSTCVFGSVE
mmetsp:Transcript_39389/g.77516  ORF Transcript_39389/g.77516 Transcript_39389/m.77516 type:complete len:250 (-) Transcript_39389:507-1256(-)